MLLAPGEMSVVDVAEPVCGPGEVTIQMEAVGLCGTDLGYWNGTRTAPSTPWVLGHEGTGRIVEVGTGIDTARIGQRVAIEPNFPCGRCDSCAMGEPALCLDRGSLALNLPGILAERVVVPATFAWSVPDSVARDAAACIEPLAVAAAAVRRAAIADSVDACLVVGAGAQGLLVSELLQAQGLRVVIAEPHEGRLARAVELGAEPLRADELFPVVFETSGAARGGETAVAHAAAASTVVLVGVGPDPIPLSSELVVRRGIRLLGSMIYDHPADFPATIDLVASGAVRPERVLGTAHPLEQSAEAFAAAATSIGKTWITLEAGAA